VGGDHDNAKYDGVIRLDDAMSSAAVGRDCVGASSNRGDAGSSTTGVITMANENQTESGTKRGGSGNFANDPERASEAGKKGGESSHGNVANDREKVSEAGKKGGDHSHGSSAHGGSSHGGK